MSDQQDDDQRRDALLLRLLKTPPQSRDETSERVRRASGAKASKTTESEPIRCQGHSLAELTVPLPPLRPSTRSSRPELDVPRVQKRVDLSPGKRQRSASRLGGA